MKSAMVVLRCNPAHGFRSLALGLFPAILDDWVLGLPFEVSSLLRAFGSFCFCFVWAIKKPNSVLKIWRLISSSSARRFAHYILSFCSLVCELLEINERSLSLWKWRWPFFAFLALLASSRFLSALAFLLLVQVKIFSWLFPKLRCWLSNSSLTWSTFWYSSYKNASPSGSLS